MMVDPDGEFVITLTAVLMGAGFGSLSGAIMAAEAGLDHREGLWKGAISGAVGGALSQIVTPGVGALSGAKAGAINGASVAFGSSFTGSLLNGENIGDSFVNGLKGAAISGGIGGIMGGVSGGVSASRHGGKFWTGDGATFDLVATSNSTKIGEDLEYSNEYAKIFSDERFGKIDKLHELYANGTLPNDSYSTLDGNIVWNSKGESVLGVTKYHANFDNKSSVYLFKGAFTSKKMLHLTMQHEYLHVKFNAMGYFGANYHNMQHSSIYRWHYNQAKQWNLPSAGLKNKMLDYRSYNNPKLDKFLPKILN